MIFSNNRQRSEQNFRTQHTVGKSRLVGLDLFRGVSAYAVVLYHSGDKTWGEIGTGALVLRDMFGFAVPFFLAVSFLFLTQTAVIAKSRDSSLGTLLGKRLQRIAIPYVIWSIVFLVFRGAFFLVTNDLSAFRSLFSDPLSIAFLGGASYQLYFLPLLLTGNVVYILLKKAYIKPRKRKLISNSRGAVSTSVLLALSIGFREVIVASGNDFDLGSYTAFQNLAAIDGIAQEPLIRLALVLLAWCSRCLPYIFAAIAFNQLFLRQDRTYEIKTSGWTLLLAVILFSTISYFDGHLYFRSVENLVIAYALVVIGFSLPEHVWKGKQLSLLQNLGSCAIGIYLVHPMIIRCATFLTAFIYPDFTDQVSVLSILSISLFSFGFSWLVISQLKRIRLFS